jgi:hypothetical protein
MASSERRSLFFAPRRSSASAAVAALLLLAGLELSAQESPAGEPITGTSTEEPTPPADIPANCPTSALGQEVPIDGTLGSSVDPDATVAVLSPADLDAITASHSATVLIWWSAQCPCVRRYHDRIEALAARWPASEVAVITVSSNAGEDPNAVIREAERRGSTRPMLIDTDGELARMYEARSTPAAVVLDRIGEPVFLGWIDNERLPGARNREAYVEDAVDALLSNGEGPDSSPMYGCAITQGRRR